MEKISDKQITDDPVLDDQITNEQLVPESFEQIVVNVELDHDDASDLDNSDHIKSTDGTCNTTIMSDISITSECTLDKERNLEQDFIEKTTLFVYNNDIQTKIKSMLSINISNDVIELLKIIISHSPDFLYQIMRLLMEIVQDGKIDFNDTQQIIEIIQITIHEISSLSIKKIKNKKYFTTDNCKSVLILLIKILFFNDIIKCDDSYEKTIINIIIKTVGVVDFLNNTKIPFIKQMLCCF
jgi:hypothetical protein